MDYIDKERHRYEDWQDRQRGNQIKYWFVVYKDEELRIDFNCKFSAEKFYSEKKFVDPDKDMELGWIWSHNICSDYDVFMENFNKVEI